MGARDFQANTASRERLKTLVSRLTDEELALPAGEGWTIAAILAHLAFWDFRVFELIQRWKKAGVGRSPIDMDNINDATKPLCLAIPVRQAALLAIQAAEMVDDALEHLPDDLMPEIEILIREERFRLNRSLHRTEHVDQIERSLAELRGKS